MLRLRRARAVWLYLLLSVSGRFASVEGQEQTSSLVLRFQRTPDVAGKEKILNLIVQRGYGAGPALLRLAKTTDDNATRWLAIRGLGMLRFQAAAPFFVESLKSDEPGVRGNAARALGELRYSQAGPTLIHLLEVEPDGGVIEQTSLALRMMKAQDAIPVMKSRMSVGSAQTRCWLLDAIAALGSKNEVPFIAKYLYNSDVADAGAQCAARALAGATGEDFGFPKGGGLFDPITPVLKARKWWEKTQPQFDPR